MVAPNETVELSFPLPKAPDTRIHLRLTIQATSLLLFLTTIVNNDTSTMRPLGSFVYALPDVCLMIVDMTRLQLTEFAENKPWTDYFDASLYIRIFGGILDSSGKAISS